MFENLQEKLQRAFKNLRGQGTLTQENIQEALKEIRMALLRNEKTPLARALEFARSLPGPLVREILQGSRLPTNIKSCVLKDLTHRSGSNGRS